jgi:NAD(P)-dependent dehydrogenase (short-subunit alcohol dehydrogenase family)
MPDQVRHDGFVLASSQELLMPTILITGANRGIGLEFARQYAALGWAVIATARAPEEADALQALRGDVRVEGLQVTSFEDVERFARSLAGQPIDLVTANAGSSKPEQIENAADAEIWVEMMRVNVIAPVLLARALTPNVAAARGKLIAISSQMGSIEDNGSGGYIPYRASKAALNAAWKSLALELKPEGIAAAMLHPGWVQTRMGGPSAPLAPEISVAAMRRTIEALGPDRSGTFLNYDGAPIPW